MMRVSVIRQSSVKILRYKASKLRLEVFGYRDQLWCSRSHFSMSNAEAQTCTHQIARP